MPVYSVNDLPRYSAWPARLLGLEPWTPRRRTKEDLLREFDQEEWGSLLRKVEQAGHPVGIDELEASYYGALQPSLRSWGDELKLLPEMEARGEHQRLVEATLEGFLPAPVIAELGAGYGGLILRMAAAARFEKVPFLAGEYTRSGVELIRKLAANMNLSVPVGFCDLTSEDVVDFRIPEGSIVFTSFALMYLPQIDRSFFRNLATLKPKAVVHFEPFHEHAQGNSMLNLLRRRYLEVNDYNVNAVTIAKEEERAGRIRILKEEPCVYGVNPLLPASILAWSPVGSDA